MLKPNFDTCLACWHEHGIPMDFENAGAAVTLEYVRREWVGNNAVYFICPVFSVESNGRWTTISSLSAVPATCSYLLQHMEARDAKDTA